MTPLAVRSFFYAMMGEETLTTNQLIFLFDLWKQLIQEAEASGNTERD